LLRTKPYGVDEGGVAAGYSVLNSLLLDGDGEGAGDGDEEEEDEVAA